MYIFSKKLIAISKINSTITKGFKQTRPDSVSSEADQTDADVSSSSDSLGALLLTYSSSPWKGKIKNKTNKKKKICRPLCCSSGVAMWGTLESREGSPCRERERSPSPPPPPCAPSSFFFRALLSRTYSLISWLFQDGRGKLPNPEEEWVALRPFQRGTPWEGGRRRISASRRLQYLSQFSGYLWTWIWFALFED